MYFKSFRRRYNKSFMGCEILNGMATSDMDSDVREMSVFWFLEAVIATLYLISLMCWLCKGKHAWFITLYTIGIMCSLAADVIARRQLLNYCLLFCMGLSMQGINVSCPWINKLNRRFHEIPIDVQWKGVIVYSRCMSLWTGEMCSFGHTIYEV